MVLQTYFVKIIGGAAQCSIPALPLIADNLGEGAVNYLFRGEVGNCFYIILLAQPLGRR